MPVAVRVSEFGLEHVKTVTVEQGSLGASDVRVRWRAASLNYRDLLIATGSYDPQMRLPRILGSDAAGNVVEVGADVKRFAVGDRVCSLFFQDWVDGEIQPETGKSALGGAVEGVFRTECVLPERGLIHAPAGWSHAEAATLPCAALTAWNALVEKGHVCAGETVLVLGTGGVSLFALQIAKMHGARVVVTSSSNEKLERARAMGADATINYRETPDWDKEVFRLTAKRGVDHVLEVGGAGTLPRSLRAVRPGGHVYVIGVLAGKGEGVDVLPVLSKSIHLDGVYVGSAAMFRRMTAAFAANGVRPVLDREFVLEETGAALEYLRGGSHFGKVVLKME